MMKNKYIVTLTYLVVILGLLIGTSFLLKPIKERNQLALYEEKYEEFMPGIELVEVKDVDSEIIFEYILAKDKTGKDVFLYAAKQFNEYGHIEIVVALDKVGTVIKASALEVNQSFSQTDLADLVINMKDKTVSSPVGSVAGVTLGSISIQEMFSEIEKIHFDIRTGKTEIINEGIVKTKIELLNNGELFGNIYILEKAVEYEGKTIIAQLDVRVNILGEVETYTITNYENESTNLQLISFEEMLSELEVYLEGGQ